MIDVLLAPAGCRIMRCFVQSADAIMRCFVQSADALRSIYMGGTRLGAAHAVN